MNEDLQCPYCQYEMTPELHKMDGEIECDGCGKTFIYAVHVTVTTRKKPEQPRGDNDK